MTSLIVAMSLNRVIGKEGGLPWHLPEDLKNFKKLTSGNVVVMGRKTYESIPAKFRPLPNRVNVVVSRSMNLQEEIIVARSVQEAIAKGKELGEVFIIGGGSIYEQALSLVDTMYISYVNTEIEGDTYFPKFDESAWDVTQEEQFETFTLKKYERKRE